METPPKYTRSSYVLRTSTQGIVEGKALILVPTGKPVWSLRWYRLPAWVRGIMQQAYLRGRRDEATDQENPFDSV